MNTEAHGSSNVPVLNGRPSADLDGRRFDLVVIGGGITGAGVARHAAQCGLHTLLLEAGDFAAGTSSRSTKLIHGGLRYLAMGDFRLVRESALERKSLLAMAPHLTEPRWMLVPARNYLEYVKLRAGISLYEWLGAVPRGERHRNWNRAGLASGEPLLDTRRLPWACVYREYLTDDARLVLATLRAAAQNGAVVCNHSRVTSIRHEEDGCSVEVVDERCGKSSVVHGACVVNAAGPWVESLQVENEPGGAGGAQPRLRPRLHLSKGVHLVLDARRLPVRNMVMMLAADERPVFAIRRGNVTYVGTTDTTHTGGAEHWPEVTAADIGYLLDTVNGHFQMKPVTAADVLATWAGLRPLIHQPGKSPREMSRRDEIWRQGALVTVAGGKLTGFRKMAEETMAVAGQVLGRSLNMPEPLAPLAGGQVQDLAALVSDVARKYQLDERPAMRLVRLYGAEVTDVLGQRPTPLSPSVFVEEVVWAVQVEGAWTLEDVVYRRLRAAWFLPDEVEEVIAGAARIAAELLGWSEAEAAAQMAAVRNRLSEELLFRGPAAQDRGN